MNQKIYKALLGGALFCLFIFLVLWMMGFGAQSGLLLVICLVGFALAFQGLGALKSFSYTFWIFAAVAIAMYYPAYFVKIGNFELKKLIVPLLQIIMVGMGATMSLRDFAGVIKMPYGVLVGILCQFTIMPFLGFTIAYSFDFSPEIAAGIVLVGASPSGLASNVMAYIAKANVALSITLTAVATLMAPFMTPFLMKTLAGQLVEVNFWKMMWDIIQVVIVPIAAGLIFNSVAHHKAPSFLYKPFLFFIVIVLELIFQYVAWRVIPGIAEIGLRNVLSQALFITEFVFLWSTLLGLVFYFMKKPELVDQMMPFVSMTAIAVIITIITAAGRDDLLKIGALLILACLIHNIMGYFLGYWACRVVGMDERSCRTIAIEVGMQNAGLASGLAMMMDKLATVGLAPAVFGPMMNITGSSLATWWRGKPIDKDRLTV